MLFYFHRYLTILFVSFVSPLYIRLSIGCEFITVKRTPKSPSHDRKFPSQSPGNASRVHHFSLCPRWYPNGAWVINAYIWSQQPANSECTSVSWWLVLSLWWAKGYYFSSLPDEQWRFSSSILPRVDHGTIVLLYVCLWKQFCAVRKNMYARVALCHRHSIPRQRNHEVVQLYN